MCSRLSILSFTLVALSWMLNKFQTLPNHGPPTLNYDGLVFFNHKNLYEPSSEAEMVELVKWAARDLRKMRVLGSGHSWSPIANSEDILVSLFKYKGLVAVHRTANEVFVTVKGGTTLMELNILLEELELAMVNLGSISYQTIAGSLSTATHGTGVNFGNLVTLVKKLRLVSGTGEIITINKNGENAELFPAAAVSLGMFGIITEVTIKVRNQFRLEEKYEHYELDNCLNKILNIAMQSEHVKLWVEHHSNVCVVISSNETSQNRRGNPVWILQNAKVGIFALIQQWMYLFPRSASAIMRSLVTQGNMFPSLHRVDVSYNVLNIPHYFPPHSESEVCVSQDSCKDAILILLGVINKINISMNYITEVRFVQGDGFWLSPHYQRNSCCVTLLQYCPDGVDAKLYFDAYYEATKKLNARVHWGKYFSLNPKDVQSMYEHLDDFNSIRKRMDPNNLFMNRFLRQTFGFV